MKSVGLLGTIAIQAMDLPLRTTAKFQGVDLDRDHRHARPMTLESLTTRASELHPLSAEEIEAACVFLLDEAQPVTQRAAFLGALHRRGETPGEIAAFVDHLLQHAVPFPGSGKGCLDVCGTGGDMAGFFNISTTTMFVAAGAGARVIKHGNRGITSKSGGADVLEALGVKIDEAPEQAASTLEKAGCCFLFAPAWHPAFKAVVPVRKLLAEQGSASIFNIIGPLMNPARPDFQLAGVFDPALVDTYAEVFKKLGRKHAWAAHGTGPDGLRLDELSPLGKTRITAWALGSLNTFEIDPLDFGISSPSRDALIGGDARRNAEIITSILQGKTTGTARDAVLLNSAAALTVAGIAPDLQSAWALAAESIDSGKALGVLQNLRAA